jgi:hypothetical protein
MKKNKNSSHKLPKQQLTSFWSQGILGVNYNTNSIYNYDTLYYFEELVLSKST